MARKTENYEEIDDLSQLTSAINLEKLTTAGMVFDLSKNPLLFLDDLADSEEDEEVTVRTEDVFERNATESFDELWKTMLPIKSTDLIRKKIFNKGIGISPNIDSTITILYSGYFENKTEPFMLCHKLHPSTFNLKEGGLMPGVELAVFSMTVGEKARFLIHYSLMYGNLGCEPHIPKKATCLVNIALLDVKEDNNNPDEREFGKFDNLKSALEKADKIWEKGTVCIKRNNIRKACNEFQQALRIMQSCKLANSKEEATQRNFISKLFLKLALCYNELHKPALACSMCHDFFKNAMNTKNPEVYLHYGRALFMLNDYSKARVKFEQGLQIDGKNTELLTELKLLKERMAIKNNLEKEISQEDTIWMKDVNGSVNENAEESVSQEFVDIFESLCDKIAKDGTITTYEHCLPPGLSIAELNSISIMAITFNLTVKINKDNNIAIFTKNMI